MNSLFLSTPRCTFSQYRAETYDSLRYHINRLQGILSATETDLQQTKGKLEEARAAAQRDRDVIRKMENRIAELEDTVSKQKSTISTQSKTISSTVKSQHRALSFSFTTPQHHWTNGQEATRVSRYQHVFNNPPPKFGLGDPVTPISAGNQATNVTSGASSTAKSTNMSAIDRLNAFVPPIGPKAAAEEKAIPISSLPRNPPEGMMIMEETNLSAMDFGYKFHSLFQKSEAFGQLYINSSSEHPDNAIDSDTMAHLILASHPDSVSGLLADPTTRFVLLVKAINVFLISKVLRMGVVIGFDSTADSEIGQMMSLLYPDAPTTVRALLYEAMRRQVNRIRNKPLFTNFYNKRKNEHATALFRLLSPLVQRNHPKIWTDFVAIIEEAHNLALTMFSGPYEFQLHFAEVGDLFDAHSMFNRDATLVRSGCVGDPQTLMRKCHRVKLGVTPTIWFRNNSVPMNEPMQVVNMGHVMLSPMAVNGYFILLFFLLVIILRSDISSPRLLVAITI
ncbi:conserved hypothetical protein [Histoplasma capsulatum var. duboisii H88]|uniref:Uncharacterized protein n=1 Tax=Ajellomyces capsulatus (strain H88) TaxID=544711 RepID=F0UFR3_AJEC8|nr:conserved hypothetical protein [Histoplasma capsulatum var. duboisii H88]